MSILLISLLIMSAVFMTLDYFINRNKKNIFSRKSSKKSLHEMVNRLSECSIFKCNPEAKSYRNLMSDLKRLNLSITPEQFNVIVVLLMMGTVLVVILIDYLYKVNLLFNMNNLKVAANLLGDTSLTNVNLTLNYKLIIFAILVTVVLPRYLLRLLVNIRKMLEDNEIIMLQTYTLMMIKAGKPVKQILVSIMERSKIFKPVFRKAVNSYSIDPNTSLKVARESTENDGFGKIIRALEQALDRDREISLIFLKSHRQFTKDIRALNRIKKNSVKSIISTVLLIIPLLAFAFVAGYPFLVYAIKMLDNAPV